MDGLIALRLVKFLGVATFAAGVLGSIALPDQRLRRHAAQWVATAGLAAVWIGGYGLLKHNGLSMGEPWISRSLLAGLLSLGAAVWTTSAPVRSPVSATLAISALTAAFGLMSARSGSALFGLVLPAIAGAITFMGLTRSQTEGAPDLDYREATQKWFLWIARAEGASLLLLLGVYMPLKYGAQIVLDGGQGWFGWVHGVLQLLYFVALSAIARVDGWNAFRIGLAFAASVVPFGTFIFERYLHRAQATTRE